MERRPSSQRGRLLLANVAYYGSPGGRLLMITATALMLVACQAPSSQQTPPVRADTTQTLPTRPDYFPLQVGNSWEYRITVPSGSQFFELKIYQDGRESREAPTATGALKLAADR